MQLQIYAVVCVRIRVSIFVLDVQYIYMLQQSSYSLHCTPPSKVVVSSTLSCPVGFHYVHTRTTLGAQLFCHCALYVVLCVHTYKQVSFVAEV